VTRATSSILFQTALAYLVITILNITVFVVLVFENQIDLISQNAVLSSLVSGTAVKYSLDAFAAERAPLDAAAFRKIEDIAGRAGVLHTVVFAEDGTVLYRSGSDPSMEQAMASAATPDEFTAINAAILKRDFEEKLFSHRIDIPGRTVELYLPFADGEDRIAVARVSLPLRDIARQMGYLYRQCVLMAILILALHSAFVLLVIRVLIRPLRSLLAATEKVSRGTLEVNDSDYYSSDVLPEGGKGWRRRRVGARRRLNYLPNPSSRVMSGRATGRGPTPAGSVAFLCNRGDRLPPGRSSGAISGGRWDPDREGACLS
jgi:hypothetical protein